MTGVYTLLNWERQVPEVFPSKYDLRYIMNANETMYPEGHMPAEKLLRKQLNKTSFKDLI
jgi:oleate hydratase